MSVDLRGPPSSRVFQRWSDANPDKEYRSQPFGAEMSDFREVGGYRLPFRVEAGNMFGTDAYHSLLPRRRHRDPVSGGPAVTAMILAVQVALPLALISWLILLACRQPRRAHSAGGRHGSVPVRARAGRPMGGPRLVAAVGLWRPVAGGGSGLAFEKEPERSADPAGRSPGVVGRRPLGHASGGGRLVWRAGAGGAKPAAGRGRRYRQSVRAGSLPRGTWRLRTRW